MKKETKKEEITETEYHHKEPQGFWSWWFSFKRKRGLSFLRIPLGGILLLLTVAGAIGGLRLFIETLRAETLFTGVLTFLLFPVVVLIFGRDAIFGGVWMYLPWQYLEEEGNKWSWKMFWKLVGYSLLFYVGANLLGLLLFA